MSDDLENLLERASQSVPFRQAILRVLSSESPRPVIPEGHKYCNGCSIIKPLTDFWSRRDRSSTDRFGKMSKCKICISAIGKAWYQEHKEELQKKACIRGYLSRHKGRITPEEAASRVADKTGICKICKDKGDVFIDHNHETGIRRGMLCARCNLALGQIDDDIGWLADAFYYLEKYKDLYGHK